MCISRRYTNETNFLVGGTVITVTGTGFLNLGTLMYRFGTKISPGSFSSISEVMCTAPSMNPSVVTVDVSNNNFDFSSNGPTFTYYGMYDNALSVMPMLYSTSSS